LRAIWSQLGRVWTLRLTLDPEDLVRGGGQASTSGTGAMTVGLLARECTVELPVEVTEPHPDVEALTALVICRPWIARRLEVRRPVTVQFAELIQKILRIEVGPVDDSLAPRPGGRTPLLSFSGGADSIAVGELLPPGTPHIHLRRTKHPRVPNRLTHVRSDAIERVAQESGQRGRAVSLVRSDLEYMCHPYATLPHWFAIAIGPLLMSEELDGGAIALGGTFDTYYMDMGRRWTGKPSGAGIAPACELIGLPLLRPALGLSEIGTMSLTLKSDLADISRSCTFGTLNAPCHECVKCVRKDLMTAAIRGDRKLPASLADLKPTSPAWKQLSGDPPYYMQAQLEFALARVNLGDGLLGKLAARLNPQASATDFMTKYYRPALVDGIPDQFRDYISKQVESKLDFMNDQDVAAAEAWSR